MDFIVTSAAHKRITKLAQLNNDNNPILRISVDGGGCGGFSYKYEFVNTVSADDYIKEIDNIKVIIDSISQQFLDNCQIDFVEELGSSRFEINNPNATASCGCGNSFAI
ncbi:MAG: iron-sulfur cluster assembly accessory protein [Rickettsiaceae bacterium]|nr:MAG: iron-sulfur cluster assembly accessory protein [Rickettsiaceae bacterium]